MTKVVSDYSRPRRKNSEILTVNTILKIGLKTKKEQKK